MSAIIIPARYGSIRFPGKVLIDIAGQTMIERVARQALKTKADTVIVVTDHEEIFNICSNISGIKALMSPTDLSTGTDRVAFAAKTIDDDIIINVQGDEPFIPFELINELIDELSINKELKMVTACTAFASLEDSLNPDAVKVVLNNNKYALYFSRYPIPFDRDNIENIVRYRHIGIYGFKRDFLFQFADMPRSMLEKNENLEQLRALENGVSIKVVKTDYNPISIDTEDDLKKALEYYNMVNKW